MNAPQRHLRMQLLGFIALAAALAGCGPNAGLDVGVRHVGAGVLFGLPTPAAPPRVSSGELVPNFPAPQIAPPPPYIAATTPTPSPPNPCPTPSPVTFPKETATTVATHPPSAATYAFRYSGTTTYNPGTPSQTVTQLPAAGTTQVEHVSPPASDGHYTFDMVETYNGGTTTTTYLVEPNSTTSVQPAQTMQAGLYLEAMVTDDGTKTATFQPQPPVELMPFPANPGAQFQSAGVDPVHQTAMEEDSPGGQVGSTERVPTCGDVVDAWHVEINGRLVGAGGSEVTTFDQIFDVATQYGGLVVAQHLKESGTDQASGRPYVYDVIATINSVPEDAAGVIRQ